ncbi:MAG: NAD(P)H-binding protein [Pseudomonadota bacterium]
MTTNTQQNQASPELTLVLGATGKTGRRVAARLKERALPVRLGSRAATPAFEWNNEQTWDACLEGVSAAYINYVPDLAMPGATDAIRTFVKKAEHHGVRKLVLLSGRGEEEAQACERIVQASAIDSTIVRASWFNQNFSEGAFVDMVRAGAITLPASSVAEPWIDVDDIADVIVAALAEPGHDGQIYDLTGPRLLTFDDLADELSQATGRKVAYVPIAHDAFIGGLKAAQVPDDVVWVLDYLFATVLDGRNAHVTDGVRRALGRDAKDFRDYAREAAATGAFEAAA